MNLHQLRARKAELRTAASAIITAPAGSDGMLTDEQRTDYDGKIKLLDTIVADEARMERQAADDAAATGKPLNGGKAAGGTEYRVFEGGTSTTEKAVSGWRTPDGTQVPVLGLDQRIADFAPAAPSAASEIGLAGFMRALVNGPKTDLERRSLSEGSISAGGAFLPVPLATEVIDHARPLNVAFQAGARTVPMTSSSLTLAKIVSDPVPGWRPENALIVESDPVFDHMSLVAHTLAVRFTVSRELLEDAPNMDAQLRAVMGQAFARGLDNAVFFGTGTSSQPLGLANTPGLQAVSMGTNGGQLTGYAPFLDAQLALQSANEGKVTAIVFAPRSNRAVAGLVDTTGQPLVAPAALAGIPFLTTSAVPITETQGTATGVTSSAFLGDFTQVLVGIRTQLQITVLNERFAEFGQVGFVGWLRADVGVARPAALAKIVGIKP